MANGEWYYAVGGQQRGPVPLETLRTLAASRQLQPQDLVWSPAMENWQQAGSVEGLFGAGGVPPSQQATVAPPYPHSTQGVGPLSYHTPEHHGAAYAGFWIRFVAAVIDGIVTGIGGACVGGMFGGFLGLGMGASGASRGDVEAVATLLGYLLGFVVRWLYEAIMTSSAAQATLGKMAVGIVVVDESGNRVSFARATGRHFGKYLSTLTLCIGYLMAGWTERKQALHDYMASTLVIYRPR
jgi:uncharacterized RDD family membrane protein YckC